MGEYKYFFYFSFVTTQPMGGDGGTILQGQLSSYSHFRIM
jgi:hypothetical protein